MYINKNLAKVQIFDTEEEAEKFKDTWTGTQLGDVGKLSNGKFYRALPSIVSDNIVAAVNKAAKHLKFNVPLGVSYTVNTTWRGCH